MLKEKLWRDSDEIQFKAIRLKSFEYEEKTDTYQDLQSQTYLEQSINFLYLWIRFKKYLFIQQDRLTKKLLYLFLFTLSLSLSLVHIFCFYPAAYRFIHQPIFNRIAILFVRICNSCVLLRSSFHLCCLTIFSSLS